MTGRHFGDMQGYHLLLHFLVYLESINMEVPPNILGIHSNFREAEIMCEINLHFLIYFKS